MPTKIGKKASDSVAATLAASLAAASPVVAQDTQVATTDFSKVSASEMDVDAALASITKSKPDRFSDELWELWKVSARTDIEFPHLRNIAFAHWALETGWGKKGGLVKGFKNFSGMKFNNTKRFREAFAHLCTSAPYTDHNNKTDNYCKLKTYEDFIEAYWLRFDVVPYYPKWRAKAKTGSPDQFINYIGPIWAPKNDSPQNIGHAGKILRCLKWMKENGYLLPTTNSHQVHKPAFQKPQLTK